LRSNWAAVLGFTALALICFGKILNGGFLVDDWWWLATVRSGAWPALGAPSQFFRPFASLVFVTWFHLFGPNPLAYHLLVLALLVSTAFAMRGIWMKLSRTTHGTGSAFCAGALFILWPTHAEAVSWISCFSDQLVVAFGTMAIWAYLAFLERPRALALLAALLSMALALLSKESAVVLPTIVVALGWAYSWRLGRPARVAFHVLGTVVLTLIYVGLRAASLHSLVAGYGRNAPHAFVSAILGLKLTTNLANDFFPFARLLALYGSGHGIAWIRPLLLLVVLGLVAAMSRVPKRSAPTSPGSKRAVAAFFLATILWLVWMPSGPYVLSVLQMALVGGLVMKTAFAVTILLIAFLLIKLGRRNWTSVVDWLTERRLELAWIPAAILTATVVENTDVLTLTDGVVQFGLLLAFLWLAYVTRPAGEPDGSNFGMRRIAVVLLLASMLAILPGLTLPIGFDGQQSRFSYLGSVFSVLFFVGVAVYLIRNPRLRFGVACAAGIAMYGAQWPPVDDWARAGTLSRDTTAEILKTPAGGKTYVLLAPATYGSALVFIGGLESIPFAIRGDSASRVSPGVLIENFMPGDGVLCQRRRANMFSFRLTPANVPRLVNLGTSMVGDRHDMSLYYDVGEAASIISIKDIGPGDRVIYVDSEGPHEIL